MSYYIVDTARRVLQQVTEDAAEPPEEAGRFFKVEAHSSGEAVEAAEERRLVASGRGSGNKHGILIEWEPPK